MFHSENDETYKTNKLHISKSSLAAPGFESLEKTLFKTDSIEDNFSQYNVINPGAGASEHIMKMTNPSLLALNKKAIKSTHFPVLTTPQKGSIRVMPATHGITSLLSKKPLSDLPEPNCSSTKIYQKKMELEKLSLEFDEDPIAYFSKRKDGRGHLYIYMKYRRERRDPLFSPYDLVKVIYDEIGKDYFQMSANGVTHFYEDGSTEHISLDQWAREESIYKSIRKLRTFNLYLFWKNFRVWKDFIKQQHYKETISKIIQFPVFYNPTFSSATIALASLTSDSDKIISKYLLQIFPSRKYKLDEFLKISNESNELLVENFTQFVQDMAVIFKELYNMLSDKKLLNVSDNEFSEIRRKNPNIGMLMTLEKKKYAEKKRRTEQMSYELSNLGNLLRELDYIMLESLRESCFKVFVEAQNSILQDQSSVFVTEVYFNDDGKVSFKPSAKTLIESVMETFGKALKTLDHLPRILRHPDLQIILNIVNFDIPKLLREGPYFQLFVSSSPLIGQVTKRIINCIKESYEQATLYVQVFKDFYPLYNLGKNWNARDYIIKQDGTPYKGPLTLLERPSDEADDEFLLHPENEPYIDFAKIHEVIMKLQNEEIRVKDIRAGIVKGAIYVDSKELKHYLTPIPREKLTSIQETLEKIKKLKNDLIARVIKNYTLKLNTEATSVDIYVDFCESLQKTEKIMPQIEREIKFVDRVNILLETEFQEGTQQNNSLSMQSTLSTQNPIKTQNNIFQKEIQSAIKVQKMQYEKYNFVVKGLSEKIESDVNKLYQRSLAIPISAKGLNTEEFLKSNATLRKKAEKLQQPIENCNRYQKILGLDYASFRNNKPLLTNIEFSEALYITIKKWEAVNSQILSVPFAHISINDFKDSVECFHQNIQKLKNILDNPTPIVSELNFNYNEIIPFISDLNKLASSRMKDRHWKQLYAECGQSNQYKENVTIQELINLGILSDSKRIDMITTQSNGECEIEISFQAIKAHWVDIDTPIIENSDESDSTKLTLGDTDILMLDIQNSIISLSKILSDKFVAGIKDNVLELAQMIDLVHRVIEQWILFQENWKILQPLFNQESVCNALPHQKVRFNVVKTKWKAFTETIQNNRKILAVCSYPTILEDFTENNNYMKDILSSFDNYIELKRTVVPRLYFLSNEEVLRLISTTDFSVFTSELKKIFMNIVRIDSHSIESDDSIDNTERRDSSNFNWLNIIGMTGLDGDIFPLNEPVNCSGQIEEWIPLLINSMHKSVKEALTTSLSRYSSNSLNEWIMNFSTYIAFITLNISFTRNIEDCFNNFDTNPRVFHLFEATLKGRIQELMATLNNPNSANEIPKLSTIITLLLYQFEKTHMLSDRNSPHDWKIDWENSLVYKYDTASTNVVLKYMDNMYEHGAEYWGITPPLIITQTVEQTIVNICNTMNQGEIPIVYGHNGAGKTNTIYYYASLFGKFIYTMPTYSDISPLFIKKVILGSILNGSWLHFSHLRELNSDIQSFIFDNVFSITKSENVGSCKYIYNDKSYPISPETKFFFSTGKIDEKLSPVFMGFARPVALSMPSVRKIIEAKLISFSFKTAQTLAQKLEEFLISATRVFNLSNVIHIHAVTIVNKAHDILIQLIDNSEIDFVNFYKDPNKTERYSLIRAAYICFIDQIPADKEKILIKILYIYLPMFDNINQYENNITGNFEFKLDKVKSLLDTTIREYISTYGSYLPADYLINKTFCLFKLLMRFSCVIICGDLNSGKSLIVHLLEHVYKTFSQNGEIVNILNGVMPLRIDSIYQNSDSWENIFGEVIIDEKNGDRVSYGLLHNIISKYISFEKTNHRILRFDGHITPKFASFLSSLISNPNTLSFNTLGTHMRDNMFNIIVETDTIESLTPEILPFVGILHLENIQHSNIIYEGYSFNTINLPSLLFFNAAKFYDYVPNDYIQKIGTVFTRYVPYICSKIKSFKSNISFNSALDRLITEAARYAIYQITSNEISEERLMICAIGYSFFHVFSSCIKHNDVDTLQSIIVEIFDIQLPKEWEKDAFPNILIGEFSHPCLMTTQVTKDGIAPIDFSPASESPMYSKTSDGKEPLMPSSIIIPIPQMIPYFRHIYYLLFTHRSFLLYGNVLNIRSSILINILSKFPNIVPITIKVSSTTSKSDLLEIIKYQTTIMTKSILHINNEKKYIFIFEGIKKTDTHLMEIIREIMTQNYLCVGSNTDPKSLDQISMTNVSICVSCDSIEGFPIRFTSLFFPIHIFKLSAFSKTYLLRKLFNIYGISSEFCEFFLPIALTHFNSYQFYQSIINIIHSPSRNFESDDDKEAMLSLLYTDLVFSLKVPLFKRDEEAIKIFEEVFKCNKFVNKFIKRVKEENFYSLTTFIFSPPDCNYISTTETTTISSLKTKLIVHLRTNVTMETLFNFSNIDNIITKPFARISLKSVIGSTRLFVVKQVCQIRGYKLYDFSEPELDLKQLQEPFNNAIYDNKVQVVVVRLSEATKNAFDSVMSVFFDFNFLKIISEEDFTELVKKITHKKEATSDDIFQNIIKIKEVLGTLIRIVVLNDTDEEIEEFNNIDLLYPSKEEICNNFIDEEKREQLSPILISISERLEEIISNNSITIFTDFVNEFKASATGIMSRTLIKNENISTSIRFFENLKELLEKIENDIEDITPKLDDLKSKSEGLKNAYTSKHDVIEMRRLKLNEESMYRTRNLRESKIDVDMLDEKLHSIIPQIEDIYNEIADINETDIMPISMVADDPPEAVRLAFTVLPTLIGEPGNYEVNGVKLMKSSAFANLIHDGVDYKKIRNDHIELIRKTLKDENFSMKNLEQVAPVLVIIRRLFEAIDLYRISADALLERKLQYNMEEKELENFHEDMKRELESMSEIEEQFVDDAKEIKLVCADLSHLDEQYQTLVVRRENANKVLENTESLISNWTREQEMFKKDDTDTMNGDVILTSAYIAYCGSLDSKERERALMSVIAILNANSISTSYQNPLIDVGNRIAAQNKISIPHELVSHEALIDLEHALSVKRAPILIDPDKVITESLFEISPVVKVSILSDLFSEMVSIAAEEGQFTIITDVDEMSNNLLSFADYKPDDPNTNIVLNGKSVVPKKGFTVILLTNKLDIDDLDPRLFDLFVPISVISSSAYVLKSRIIRSIIFCESPELLKRYDVSNATELEHQVQTGQREFNLLEKISLVAKTADANGGFLSDNASIKSIFEAKESYFSSINGSPESHAIAEEINEVIESYEDFINYTQNIWICIARYLPKLSAAYKFKFSEFEKFIVTHIKANKERENLKKEFLNGIISFLGQSLLLRDLYFFLVLVAFLTEDIPWDDLIDIIDNLSKSLNRKYTFAEGIPMAPLVMMKDCSLPEFTNHLFNFVTQRFGDISAMVPPFLAENAVPVNNAVPTLIISTHEFDPLSEVYNYAVTRAKADIFESITLRDDNVEEVKKLINSSLLRGVWIFINYVTPSLKSASLINSIPDILSRKSISINFKVFISCHTLKYISSTIFSISKKISINPIPSTRNIMSKALHVNAQSLRSSSNYKQIYRLMFSSLMAFSSLSIRSFVHPLGMLNAAPLRNDTIREMFNIYSHYVNKADDTPLNMVNIRALLQKIPFGSNTIESNDRRLVRAILATTMSGSCLEDNFTCMSNMPNCKTYQQPVDCMPQSYNSLINAMPLLPQADVILSNYNNSDLLLQTELSKWFSVPFLSIYNPKEYIMEEEEICEKCNEYLSKVPEPITGVEVCPSTPLLLFWTQEISIFNQNVNRVSRALKNPQMISKEIEDDQVPEEWDAYRDTFNNYLNTMGILREKLCMFITNPNPTQIDAKFIQRPKEFIAAYAAECGTKIELSFNPRGAMITGLWSFNCQMKGNILSNSEKPFEPAPPIYINVMKPDTTKKVFHVPVFENIKSGEMEQITDVTVNTDMNDRTLLLNCVSFYWTIPPQYK